MTDRPMPSDQVSHRLAWLVPWRPRPSLLSVAAVAVGSESGSVPWKLVLLPAVWAVPGVLVAAGRPGESLGLAHAGHRRRVRDVGVRDGVDPVGRTGRCGLGGLVRRPRVGDRRADRSADAAVPALRSTPVAAVAAPRRRRHRRPGRARRRLVHACAVRRRPRTPGSRPTWRCSRTRSVCCRRHWVRSVRPGHVAAAGAAPAGRSRRGRPAAAPRRRRRERLVGVLGAAAVFALLAVVGRQLWPSAADVLDVAGSVLLAGALASAVFQRRLHGVDVVVHHAIVYTVLTVTIAAGTSSPSARWDRWVSAAPVRGGCRHRRHRPRAAAAADPAAAARRPSDVWRHAYAGPGRASPRRQRRRLELARCGDGRAGPDGDRLVAGALGVHRGRRPSCSDGQPPDAGTVHRRH